MFKIDLYTHSTLMKMNWTFIAATVIALSVIVTSSVAQGRLREQFTQCYIPPQRSVPVSSLPLDDTGVIDPTFQEKESIVFEHILDTFIKTTQQEAPQDAIDFKDASLTRRPDLFTPQHEKSIRRLIESVLNNSLCLQDENPLAILSFFMRDVIHRDGMLWVSCDIVVYRIGKSHGKHLNIKSVMSDKVETVVQDGVRLLGATVLGIVYADQIAFQGHDDGDAYGRYISKPTRSEDDIIIEWDKQKEQDIYCQKMQRMREDRNLVAAPSQDYTCSS
jgi:hypothetical protein